MKYLALALIILLLSGCNFWEEVERIEAGQSVETARLQVSGNVEVARIQATAQANQLSVEATRVANQLSVEDQRYRYMAQVEDQRNSDSNMRAGIIAISILLVGLAFVALYRRKIDQEAQDRQRYLESLEYERLPAPQNNEWYARQRNTAIQRRT